MPDDPLIPRAPIDIQVTGADPRIKFVAVSERNLNALEAEVKQLRGQVHDLKEANEALDDELYQTQQDNQQA